MSWIELSSTIPHLPHLSIISPSYSSTVIVTRTGRAVISSGRAISTSRSASALVWYRHGSLVFISIWYLTMPNSLPPENVPIAHALIGFILPSPRRWRGGASFVIIPFFPFLSFLAGVTDHTLDISYSSNLPHRL